MLLVLSDQSRSLPWRSGEAFNNVRRQSRGRILLPQSAPQANTAAANKMWSYISTEPVEYKPFVSLALLGTRETASIVIDVNINIV